MSHILLTNDDGIEAEGLRELASALEGLGTVSVVAPSREQSGSAQSLTLRQPIVCHALGERRWAVDGTPADCIIVALHKLLPERPDLVISGINHGGNLGENVYYSGTVGAAREAAIHHLPAMAVSLVSKSAAPRFAAAARLTRSAAELILREGLPEPARPRQIRSEIACDAVFFSPPGWPDWRIPHRTTTLPLWAPVFSARGLPGISRGAGDAFCWSMPTVRRTRARVPAANRASSAWA